MADHPIHQANENSPYGDLTREEFYKKHQIIHHESFMLNNQNMKIFTQSWRPDSTSPLRGLVAMIHGYTSQSSWINELTAVAIARAGFLVCALDLQGHGFSEGFPGHIPKIEPLVLDCIQFFDAARTEKSDLPAFLYGESLGAAIAILICLKQKKEWKGLVLNGAMCGVSAKYKPIWPLEKLLPLAAMIAPTWKISVTKPIGRTSYKEDWKKKLVARNPNRRTSGKPAAAAALTLCRVCEYVRKHAHELEVPFLMVHGEDDRISDPQAARLVFESAASEDKTLKIFPGMWHMLVGEPKENVEAVFGTVLAWLGDRAQKAKSTKFL